MFLSKLKMTEEKDVKELEKLANEAELLLDSEMTEAEGGCWTCDDYCKQCVSGHK